MSALNPRSTWVDPKYPVTGPKPNLTKVDAIVIHYPGVNPGALNLNDPVGVLRNTHRFYLGKKPVGYSIGYNFATFPGGRYELRGFDIVNAANKGHNDHTISINVMVNGADKATDAQVGHTRDMVADIWARLGREVPLIAHGALSGAATACPGAGVRSQFALFVPQPPAPIPVPPPEPTPVPPTPSTSEVSEMFLIKGSAPDVWLVVPHADSKKTRRVHVTPEQFDDDVIDFGTPRNVVDVNEWGKVAG